MDCTEERVGTLRAQDHGHPPIVMGESSEFRQDLYQNHSADSRYTGPEHVSPTLSAMGGTGGGNLPIIARNTPVLYNRQRVDQFSENDIASTESARQCKDATDLVMQQTLSDLPTDDNSPAVLLIRRLTPTECERLMGLPDGFTDIPGASDSKRYRALGNSIVIPCVEYIMRGIALAASEPVNCASS